MPAITHPCTSVPYLSLEQLFTNVWDLRQGVSYRQET